MIKIIGDIMLDRWVIGPANRISPEAPVLIIKEEVVTTSPGGAANLAINLSNILNDKIQLYGAVSDGLDSICIIECLRKYENIQTLFDLNHSMTTTKTRLMDSTGHYLIRLDREEKYTGELCVDDLINCLNLNDVVLISDYNKGVIQEDTVSRILNKTSYVFVDPKQKASHYNGSFLVKPNMNEYEQWNGKFTVKSALKFMKKNSWTWLVVTDGENGIHVLNKKGEYHQYNATVHEVADVTGAGDTVLAVIAYGYINGMNIPDACKLACHAASRGVERRGVSPVRPEDLIMDQVVWTNGVFDILHTGHLELLKFAKAQGKRLIVELNSDESVKRIKGSSRPINNIQARKSQIETLPWVDEVVVFEEDSPYEVLKKIRPDIIVKGGDYKIDEVVGSDLAKVVIYPILDNYSSSAIIQRTEEGKL